MIFFDSTRQRLYYKKKSLEFGMLRNEIQAKKREKDRSRRNSRAKLVEQIGCLKTRIISKIFCRASVRHAAPTLEKPGGR